MIMELWRHWHRRDDGNIGTCVNVIPDEAIPSNSRYILGISKYSNVVQYNNAHLASHVIIGLAGQGKFISETGNHYSVDSLSLTRCMVDPQRQTVTSVVKIRWKPAFNGGFDQWNNCKLRSHLLWYCTFANGDEGLRNFNRSYSKNNHAPSVQ